MSESSAAGPPPAGPGGSHKYASAIERLGEAGVVTSQTLDKALLTLSAGSIAVSLTFLDDLLNRGAAPTKLLYIAWVLFMCVIVLTLLGLRTAAERINVQMGFYNLLQQGALDLGGELRKGALESGKKTESLIKRTRWLNDFALGFFVLALIILFAFGLRTVKGGDMTEDQKRIEKAVDPLQGAAKKGYTGDSIPAHLMQQLEGQTQPAEPAVPTVPAEGEAGAKKDS